jgi:hypothetical protein
METVPAPLCESSRCRALDFAPCDRPAVMEVKGDRYSGFRMCRDCKERLVLTPGNWTITRLRSTVVPPELLVFAIALIAGVAIALSGCGQVEDASDGAQLAPGGANGAAADAGALAGAGGAGGAPIASATGGAAAAGRGGAGEAGHGDNGGAAGSQMGGAAGSAPTCPKVGSLVNKVSGHCWVCQEENDAGFVSGTIAGPCEISAADIARFSGAASAGSLCVSSTRGTYPAVCY